MLDGFLNVYKEQGYTSFDVVAKLRGILKQKKIGHTGTLDPMAEGVLLVCLGQATKLSEMLIDKDKTYRCVMLLGKTTDTEDVTGKVLTETADIPDEASVIETVNSFIGTYDQIPPMYSAIKVNGKKLYEYARQGIEIERSPREVTIFELKIEDVSLPRVTFTVHCSKGTYIRSLCQDIGEKLGCGAVMEKLVRTEVKNFRVEDSLTLAEIEQARDQGTIGSYVMKKELLLPEYPELHIGTDEYARKLLRNGNKLQLSQFAETVSPETVTDVPGIRVYDETDSFAAIYRYETEKGSCQPVKMFPKNAETDK